MNIRANESRRACSFCQEQPKVCKASILEGAVISINKPLGMSSFGAVAYVRTRLCRAIGLKKLKVGHAGTLDPLATGVLIICTGKATKRISTLQTEQKEYVATLQFGAITPSYDSEYPVSETFDTADVCRESLLAVLPAFIGDLAQVPPAFSACSVGGKRAYEYARQNKEVALSAKHIHIDTIELLAYDDTAKTAQMRIVCGKGTYIRALARDIGTALHSGAYLTSLCRTRVGQYDLSKSIAIDDFEDWIKQQDINQ